MEAIKKRLEAGKREYGDSTYGLSSSELAYEIEEELLDVAGWAFFLWLQINGMKNTIKTCESNMNSDQTS